MLGRIARIFGRYVEANLRLSFPVPRQDETDESPLRIERAELYRNRLILEGKAKVEKIGLRIGSQTIWSARAEPLGQSFHFDIPYIPYARGRPVLVLQQQGEVTERFLPEVPGWRLRLARLRLGLRFAAQVIRLTPQIWLWRWRGDGVARQAVKEALGLAPQVAACMLPHGLVLPAPARGEGGTAKIVLVMPVFNALDLLREALSRIERHTDHDWHLILIEDASSDPQVRPFLRNWARDLSRAPRVTLLENPTNLGFVGSVNRGFARIRAQFPGRSVILINSDALVPAGWASRLIAPLRDPAVASVTPMSDNAEILSVPIPGGGALPVGAVDRIDAAARLLTPELTRADLPTGIGFCMAISPRFLARLPAFDPCFGKGYGEETDWCQRAGVLGGRHVGIGNLFVEHRGTQSFDVERKSKLLARNHAQVLRRHPCYEPALARFLSDDPLAPARMALALAAAGAVQDAPVRLWLGHALGGGAERYLRERIAEEIARGHSAVVLRVGLRHRWQLELHQACGTLVARSDDDEQITRLVALLGTRRVVYSCGVNDPDPISLPKMLLRLSKGQELEVLFHDYYPISPSYCLLGQDGLYHGPPRPGTPIAADPAHRWAGLPGGLDEWQAAWGELISSAQRLVVFSRASRDIVAQVWPEAASRIVISPHQVQSGAALRSPAIRPGAAPPVIGVLGNIGAQKGAAIVARLSHDLARSGAAQLVVIGNLDPHYRLARPALVHGSYEPKDLPLLVSRYGITGWLIPSIWPETFSFTTHEALATGLPVACFDLGAQAEAVSGAGAQGILLPCPGVSDECDLTPLLRAMTREAMAA
ncbi:glycosyltransferase [Thioclava atlantica]|uniref:Glycosyl transferase family protein n=1 Tax=Thioclava atlantica TaxID=1317124 RepID=A0A085TRV9_9RHOB|nr:glycosyltransferase [Thioclava atlantica]KFE33456.1 glycosyl transferase family protein [Thioclava atlantica]